MMNNDEVKIFSNMTILLPKIELKKVYLEEDYFIIFKLIDGYKKIKKYFNNNITIDNLLDQKAKDISLYDLLRIVKNSHSHIDKHNAINSFVILQVEVKCKPIHELITEIKEGMSEIFDKYFKEEPYRLIVNTREIMNVFELVKSIINNPESRDDLDKHSKELFKPIINDFKCDNSTLEDYYEMISKVIGIYKLPIIKDGIINKYGKLIYNDMLRMMTDESFTEQEATELINKMKKIDNLEN